MIERRRAVMLSGINYTPKYITDGLIVFYDAENNAGKGVHNPSATTWKDLSGNNNDGKFVNITNPIWGKNYLQFDGIDDYIEVLNQQSQLGQSFTICANFISDEVNNYRGLIGVHDNKGGILWQHTEGELIMDVMGDNLKVSLPNSNALIQSSFVYTVDKGLYATGYRNGSAFGSYQAGKPISSLNNDKLVLGRSLINTSSSMGQRNFKGRVYNLLIYNRALTAAEVVRNYNTDKGRFNF